MNKPGTKYDTEEYAAVSDYSIGQDAPVDVAWEDICPIPREDLPLVVSVSGTLFTFKDNDHEVDKTSPVLITSNLGTFTEGNERAKFTEAMRIVNEKYLPVHQEKYPDKHMEMKDAEIRARS